MTSQTGLDDELYAMFHRAIEIAARGQWSQAAEILLSVHAAAPESALVMVQAAHVLLKLDRYREAHSIALRVAERPIEPVELLSQAIRLVRRFEEPQALAALIARSQCWRTSRSGPLLGEIALHLGSAGLFQQATELLDHACTMNPAYHHVHYLRGAIATFAGNSDSARWHLHRSLELEPNQGHVHWMLSMQNDSVASDEEIAGLIAASRMAVPGSENQAYLAYALHNRFHSSGRYEEAWAALEMGNAIKHTRVPYDRPQCDRLFDALMGMDVPACMAARSEPTSTGLIFIVGMHRSGTSLLERVLAGHPSIADGGETYAVTGLLRHSADHFCHGVVDETIVSRSDRLDYAELRERLLNYAAWRSGGRLYLTEKLPSNFLNLGFIMRALPDARILHMKRDPIDTCFSNLRTFFGQAAPYSYDQEDVAHYYQRYRRLMMHWHDVAPGRILDVDYDLFVNDPESTVRTIFEYCGLDFVPTALQVERAGGISATASMGHVRKGILTNRGNAWRNYERHLQPLIRALA
jgi:tetratricopeptide (TPR) repeat protein